MVTSLKSARPLLLIKHSRRPTGLRATDETELCRDKVALPKKLQQGASGKFTVTFLSKDGQTTQVPVRSDEYILMEAENFGLDLPCTCRGGICGACVGRVVEGEVDMSDIPDITFTLTEEEIQDGMALLCMSRAKSDLIIETQCDWGYSLGISDWKGASGQLEAKPQPLMGEEWDKQNEL